MSYIAVFNMGEFVLQGDNSRGFEGETVLWEHTINNSISHLTFLQITHRTIVLTVTMYR